MEIKKLDLILLIACVIIFGAASFVLPRIMEKGDYVTVSVDGEIISTYSLNDNGEYLICGYNGSSNTLVIDNGEASIKEADCPDKLCVNQKAISSSGESLCCLPNRVIVEITSDEENEVDAIAR